MSIINLMGIPINGIQPAENRKAILRDLPNMAHNVFYIVPRKYKKSHGARPDLIVPVANQPGTFTLEV